MQKKLPFISVIIDNYNYAQFLSQAIDSVLNQNYPFYEIIVIDDASTDDSRKIILAYDRLIKPIFLKKNCGQGNAFNIGWQASQGELLAFLDADDLFLENKLMEIGETFAASPQTDLIYHQGYMINKNLGKIDKLFPKKTPHGLLRKKILRVSETGFPPTSFLTFRKSFLDKIFPLDPFLNRIDADFPMQVLASLLGKIEVIKKPLAFYRLHGDNWFSNNEFATLELPDILRIMKRTERSFYYINKKLSILNDTAKVNLLHNRFHRRNLFIFKKIGWSSHLFQTFFRFNSDSLFELINFIWWGAKRRLEYLRGNWKI